MAQRCPAWRLARPPVGTFGRRPDEGVGAPGFRSYPLNFYARCGEVVHYVFTTSLVAGLPRWERGGYNFPTSSVSGGAEKWPTGACEPRLACGGLRGEQGAYAPRSPS